MRAILARPGAGGATPGGATPGRGRGRRFWADAWSGGREAADGVFGQTLGAGGGTGGAFSSCAAPAGGGRREAADGIFGNSLGAGWDATPGGGGRRFWPQARRKRTDGGAGQSYFSKRDNSTSNGPCWLPNFERSSKRVLYLWFLTVLRFIFRCAAISLTVIPSS